MDTPETTGSAAKSRGLARYRCTTDKLLDSLAELEENGDTVMSAHFVGGRDWHILFRPVGTPSQAGGEGAGTGDIAALLREVKGLREDIRRSERRVERAHAGVRP